MEERKTIIVTGGTRGIGFALVCFFLENGCNVVYSGTSASSIKKAAKELKKLGIQKNSIGVVSDITKYKDSKNLIEKCEREFGGLDIFINNAGINQKKELYPDLKPRDIQEVIEVNTLGTMYGTLAAIKYFNHHGGGMVYVMEGFGSDDRMADRSLVYGTSKRAVRYFGRALAKEARNSRIKIGILSPGMVATDFLKKSLKDSPPKEAESHKKIFNILADEAVDVAEFLGRKILANTRNDARFYWLTTVKSMGRFISAPFRKRELF